MKLELTVNGVALVIDGDFTIQMRSVGSAPAAVAAPAPAVAVAPALPVAPVAPVAVPAPVAPVADNGRVNPAPTNAADSGLFARLSGLRRELAAAAGVPPYVIFQDKTLHEMVAQMPADMAAFSQIPGVGAARLEKYGAKFLAALRAAA